MLLLQQQQQQAAAAAGGVAKAVAAATQTSTSTQAAQVAYRMSLRGRKIGNFTGAMQRSSTSYKRCDAIGFVTECSSRDM